MVISTVFSFLNQEFTQNAAYFKGVDEAPELGDNFYRLKQEFEDSTAEYSEVRAVKFGIDLNAISFFPNPAQNELFLNLSEYQGKQATIIISNKYGQIMEQIDLSEIPAELVKVNLSSYQNGLYFVRTKIARSKFVGQKVFISKMY